VRENLGGKAKVWKMPRQPMKREKKGAGAEKGPWDKNVKKDDGDKRKKNF